MSYEVVAYGVVLIYHSEFNLSIHTARYVVGCRTAYYAEIKTVSVRPTSSVDFDAARRRSDSANSSPYFFSLIVIYNMKSENLNEAVKQRPILFESSRKIYKDAKRKTRA
jgi:hypothetical protein